MVGSRFMRLFAAFYPAWSHNSMYAMEFR